MDDDFLTQTLSNLPRTSNAFSRFKNVSLSVVDVDPTASPPRKWARTRQDQDISRNKGKGKARAQVEAPGEGLNPKAQVLRVGNMIREGLQLLALCVPSLMPKLQQEIALHLSKRSSKLFMFWFHYKEKAEMFTETSIRHSRVALKLNSGSL